MKYWTDIEYVLPDCSDLLEYYWTPNNSNCPLFETRYKIGGMCETFDAEECTYSKNNICIEHQGPWEETTEEHFFSFFFNGIESGQYFDYDDEKSVKDNFFDYVYGGEENEIFERYLVWRRKQDIDKRNKEFWFEYKKGERANSSALLQC